jgi:hypothetical protein
VGKANRAEADNKVNLLSTLVISKLTRSA